VTIPLPDRAAPSENMLLRRNGRFVKRYWQKRFGEYVEGHLLAMDVSKRKRLPLRQARLRYTYYHTGPSQDKGNFIGGSEKVMDDALVEWGVIADDSIKHIVKDDPVQVKLPTKEKILRRIVVEVFDERF
jgi:hypothetical protein